MNGGGKEKIPKSPRAPSGSNHLRGIRAMTSPRKIPGFIGEILKKGFIVSMRPRFLLGIYRD